MHKEWKIWVDANISPAIAKWMSEFTGYDVKSAFVLNLYYLSDKDIFEMGRNAGNVILVSKDSDFPELVTQLGTPPKLIYLRVGNCDNRKLWRIIKPNIKEALNILTTTDTSIIEMSYQRV